MMIKTGRPLILAVLIFVLSISVRCAVEPALEPVSSELFMPAVLSPSPLNGDFELSNTTHAAYWWNPDGGPYYTEFGEVNVPLYWTGDWFEGFQCPGTPFWNIGRPEVGIITTGIDETRVRSGNQALKLFTFHRCHVAGVHQRFATIPGQWYRLTAYGHSWCSNCSIQPHYTGCALDWDCKSCTSPDHQLFVGLDPAGGINPFDSSVVLSPPHIIYGQYAEPLIVIAQATGNVMTAHLLGIAPLPWRHDDDYWDDVTVEQVQVYFFPFAVWVPR